MPPIHIPGIPTVMVLLLAAVCIILFMSNSALRNENRELIRELSARGYSPWKHDDMFTLLRKYLLDSSNQYTARTKTFREQRRVESTVAEYADKILPMLGCECKHPSIILFNANSSDKELLIGHEEDCPASISQKK